MDQEIFPSASVSQSAGRGDGWLNLYHRVHDGVAVVMVDPFSAIFTLTRS